MIQFTQRLKNRRQQHVVLRTQEQSQPRRSGSNDCKDEDTSQPWEAEVEFQSLAWQIHTHVLHVAHTHTGPFSLFIDLWFAFCSMLQCKS